MLIGAIRRAPSGQVEIDPARGELWLFHGNGVAEAGRPRGSRGEDAVEATLASRRGAPTAVTPSQGGLVSVWRPSLLRILARRGIEVPEAVRAEIDGCTDLDRLGTWTDRALDATSIDDVFGR